MTLPCETIQDLLPLYHDGVCSSASNQLVQEHLKACPQCRLFLQEIEADLHVQESEPDTAKGLVTIQKMWRKGLIRSTIKGFAAAALVFGIFIGGFLALTQWNCLPVSTWNCSVAEIYQLEDGRILFRMETPEDVWCRSFQFEHHEDGSDYKIPVRPLISLNQLRGIPSMWDGYHMIDPAENNAWQKAHGHGNPVTKWYWGHPEEAILVYEEGMELEPAPKDLEAKFGVG